MYVCMYVCMYECIYVSVYEYIQCIDIDIYIKILLSPFQHVAHTGPCTSFQYVNTPTNECARYWCSTFTALPLLVFLFTFWTRSVLCCPGCFSLYRMDALRSTLKTYSTQCVNVIGNDPISYAPLFLRFMYWLVWGESRPSI